MNACLNYLLEASIGLCLFLGVYQLLLRKETSFRVNRVFLLIAITASVTFPLISFTTTDSPVPTLGLSVDTTETQQYSSSDEIITESAQTGMNTWEGVALLYVTGLIAFMGLFILRLRKMFRILKKSDSYTYNHHRIIELKSNDSPFSFFNYIFIGNTPPLTEKEKQQIVAHESIHAKLYHSFDIVLLNILGIVFWFNPVIRIYKKIFVQLHEFEADARAVETHDVDEYCSLLAKVALHSADYKLANHFSNSLTVKRIEMMRTLKHKIKSWKVVAAITFLPILFFVVACQDQVETPNVSDEKTYPAQVQKAIDRLVAANPEVEYIVAPPGGPNLKDFEGKHAKHLLYINGEPIIESESIVSVQVGKDEKGNAINYVIFVYNNRKTNPLPTEEQWKQAAHEGELEINEKEARPAIFFGPLHPNPEQEAIPPGGLTAFENLLKRTVKYPEAYRQAGVSGKVLIEVTVSEKGKPAVFNIVKGINKELNQEALRIIKANLTGWKAATEKGQPVTSKLVLTVEFKQ